MTDGPRTRVAVAGLSCCVALACSGRQRAPEPEPFEPPEIARIEGSLDDLSGRWAQLQVTTSESTSALAGTVASTNRRLFVFDVVDDGGELSFEGELCDMDIETSTSLADTVVPEAFVDAFPIVRLTGDVGEDEQGATTVRIDRSRELLGLSGQEPDAELPDRVDDPRVVDADGDGHPGVTVRVTGLAGGEMYFVQSSWRQLQTTSVTGTTMDGAIEWSLRSRTLDATSRQLRNARPSSATEDPARNYFRTTRIADGATCQDVIAAGAALFVRRDGAGRSDGP